jgi:transcriptional regulator with XRE-family HTH domain
MNEFSLKRKLRRIGMTQKEFAELCGVHYQTVYRWCCGAIRTPKYARMVFEVELEGINIERELKRLVEEGLMFDGVTADNCPSYGKMSKLIERLKAISSAPKF